jgi:Recombinase
MAVVPLGAVQIPAADASRRRDQWLEASNTAIHHVLTNPVYAGPYSYGRTQQIVLDAASGRKKRLRHLPRAEWQVLIPNHHPGFIDWQTYKANQERLARNTMRGPHKAGGAVREGAALLQELARCGHCGRRTYYRKRNASPGYHCAGKLFVDGRGAYCLNIGGIQIDAAVIAAFLAALEPTGFAATVAAAERLESDRDAALKQ